jgi:hypothetical protein
MSTNIFIGIAVIIGAIAVIALIIACVTQSRSTITLTKEVIGQQGPSGVSGSNGIDGQSANVEIQNNALGFFEPVNNIDGWDPPIVAFAMDNLFRVGDPVDSSNSEDILPTDPWGTTRYVPLTCVEAGKYIFYAQTFVQNTTASPVTASFHIVQKNVAPISNSRWNQLILTQDNFTVPAGVVEDPTTKVTFLSPSTYNAIVNEVLYVCYCSTSLNHLAPSNLLLTIFKVN